VVVYLFVLFGLSVDVDGELRIVWKEVVSEGNGKWGEDFPVVIVDFIWWGKWSCLLGHVPGTHDLVLSFMYVPLVQD
jgi:hypothetical protein